MSCWSKDYVARVAGSVNSCALFTHSLRCGLWQFNNLCREAAAPPALKRRLIYYRVYVGLKAHSPD